MLSKVLLSISALAAAAQAVSVEVQSSGGNATSPYQYGIMFEDINNSGDGGVYAELVQNRAFQGDDLFPKNLSFWSSIGGASLSLQNLSKPLSAALPTSVEVTGGNGTVGLRNAGFWGFPVVSSWEYKGSFWVSGNFDGHITVALQANHSAKTWVSTDVKVSSLRGHWTKYSYTFQPSSSAPDANNTLTFTWPASQQSGALNFNLLSLFPPTYNNRPNGLRVDLVEALAGLKPSFFRLPGGNNVEGTSPPYLWNWTQALGPLEDRTSYPGTWRYEQTNGLGLIEYMLWAKDLGTEPVFAVWSGLWLNSTVVPESDIQTYVQFALDELEFLMGDTSTTWGSYRARLGYPTPFEINFVEVGNEDSLSGGKASYGAYRFPAFYNAISAAYPNMTIIASYYNVDETTGTPGFKAAGDFHEYAIPREMSAQFGYFDNYSSAYPILLGEYAVVEYDQPGTTGVTWQKNAPRAGGPFWYGSVAEAIYLLGAERNGDKIIGASYAPAFQNLNRWEWIPDMIAYDAYPGNTVLSTSYYVVQLLSSTRITENLPMTGAEFNPAYYVAGRSAVTGSHIFKAAVYNSTGDVPFSVKFHGVSQGATAKLTYLTAPMNATSSIGHNIVQTHTSSVTAGREGYFNFQLPDYSVAVLEVGAGSGGQSGKDGWKGWKSWGRDVMNAGKWNQWGQGWS